MTLSATSALSPIISGPLIGRTVAHGRPRPNQMSKMFDPTALAIAMSPSPARATAMDDSASGMDVPAARSVMPVIASGILQAQPKVEDQSTINQEIMPIHNTDDINVSR